MTQDALLAIRQLCQEYQSRNCVKWGSTTAMPSCSLMTYYKRWEPFRAIEISNHKRGNKVDYNNWD